MPLPETKNSQTKGINGRDLSRSPRGEKAQTVKVDDNKPDVKAEDNVILVETTGASSSDDVIVEIDLEPPVDLLDNSQEPPDPRMEAGLQHIVYNSMRLGHSNDQLHQRLTHYREKFQRMLDRIDQGYDDWESESNSSETTLFLDQFAFSQ